MGPIGLSVEEENLRAAPGTPQAAQAEGGMLFSKIAPKSNMGDAIQGETLDITLTKKYFTEGKEEAKAIARAAIIPKELECFEQARKVMRLIRNRKVVRPLIPADGEALGCVDNCRGNGCDAFHLPLHSAERDEPCWPGRQGDG